MSKPKKNLGKLKHYKRIFHTRDQIVHTALAWAAGIIAVFVVGYLAAPAVLDFGTHTWYTVVKGRDLDSPSSAAASEPAPAQSAPAESQPEATPAPTPVPKVDQGSWAFASLSGGSAGRASRSIW